MILEILISDQQRNASSDRSQPGVTGGGTKKFYASANSSGEKSLAGLTKQIEKISTVSGADIRAVLYALMDVMQDSLSEGEIVRPGELGSLRVNVSSEGHEQADEVSASSIKNARVIFTPGKGIKDMLQNLEFVKVA